MRKHLWVGTPLANLQKSLVAKPVGRRREFATRRCPRDRNFRAGVNFSTLQAQLYRWALASRDAFTASSELRTSAVLFIRTQRLLLTTPQPTHRFMPSVPW
jgi:hypothetical protein